jgi:hypothetical protein
MDENLCKEELENECMEHMIINALADINTLEKELIKILQKKKDISNIAKMADDLRNEIVGLHLKYISINNKDEIE